MRQVHSNPRKRDFAAISDASPLTSGFLASTAEKPLCERCGAIDFNEILQRSVAQDPKRGSSGQSLFLLGEVGGSRCPLCRFFWEMRFPETSLKSSWAPDLTSEAAALEYDVRAFSSMRVRLPDFRGVRDTVMLGVVPLRSGSEKIHRGMPPDWNCMSETGHIYPVIIQNLTEGAERFSGRLIDPCTVDFDQIGRWVNFCQEKHSKFCGVIEEASLPGFQVIDCETRQVVPAGRGCSYVALSYVWGQVPEEFRATTVGLPPALPNLIEDAITVVKKLNMRYLWVDRYCIPQDSDQKHDQILSMDLVYKNAEVTIIGLAGGDPSVGLPGVGRGSRAQQSHVMVGGVTLVSSLPSLQAAIARSVWGTRGWTYQEGVMSRRRLIFTEYQVYFECMGMNCQESIITPLKVLHTRDMQAFKQSCHRLRAFPSRGVGRYSVALLDCIQDYVTRTLTYDSDIINAFSGILRSFEKMRSPVSHFWGVPVFPTHRKQVQWADYAGARPETPSYQLAFGMIWSTSEPARRRRGFPSWSWTGWAEVASLQFPKRYGTMSSFWTGGNPDAEFWIELNNGSLVPWETFLEPSHYANNVRMASPFLHVEAWLIPAVLKYFASWKRIRNRGRLELTESWPQHKIGCWAARIGLDERWWPVRMTQDLNIRHDEEAVEEKFGKGDAYEAMFLNGKYPNSQYLLILQQIEDHFERVGIAGVASYVDAVEYKELERRRVRLG